MRKIGLMLVAFVPLYVTTPVLADWTFNLSTGHWYQLTASGLTWTQAEQAGLALGGHLVTINDNAENNWVRDTFGTASSFVIWIGLYQLPGSTEPAGGWVWSNGEPVVYTNWLPGNPNNGGAGSTTDENFGHMYGFGNQQPGSYGLWNDIDVGPSTHVGPGIIERSCPPDINCPTVSQWGLLVMAGLVVAAGGSILAKRRVLAR